MKLNRISRKKKRMAWSLIAIMLIQSLAMPTSAFALTGGPQQPEFTTFNPVSASDMVNTFTGDFSYNLPVLSIPGADGGGYALSLGYNANPSVDGPASWVGYNWSLNPGSISRSTMGIADDLKGKEIIKYNKSVPSFTASLKKRVGLEVASNSNISGGLSLSQTTRFNNYTGLMKTMGAGLSVTSRNGPVQTSGGANVSFTGKDTRFSANVSISIVLNRKISKEKRDNIAQDVYGEYSKLPADEKLKQNKWKERLDEQYNSIISHFTRAYKPVSGYSVVHSIGNRMTTNISKNSSIGFNISPSFKAGAVLGSELGLDYTVDYQWSEPMTTYKGYGYMYNPNRTTYNNASSSEPILADYRTDKESPFSKQDKYMGVPFNNADNFVAMGEGVLGSFRLHHNAIGNYYLEKVVNTGGTGNLGVEIGVGGDGISIGANLGVGASVTRSKRWFSILPQWSNNLAGNIDEFEFEDPHTTTNKPYFTFLGDKGSNIKYTAHPANVESAILNHSFATDRIPYFEDSSYDDLGDANEEGLRTNDPGYNGQSSDIEYALNKDMSDINKVLDKNSRTLALFYNTINDQNLDDNVAQIQVTNENGARYTYGVPAYVKNEKQMRYGVNDDADVVNNELLYQEVKANPLDNRVVIGQELGDGVQYAASYLLTQITNVDYVDVNDDGLTEDDFGGYTRFDYRKGKQTAQHGYYAFRSPHTGLGYEKGSIADEKDDFGMVTSGERQQYYLNAIETKSHIAIFITDQTNASIEFHTLCPNCTSNPLTSDEYDGSVIKDGALGRLDGVSADNGTDPNDPSLLNAANSKNAKGAQRAEKLERIVLFSKADLKAGLNKPLVTTYFDYDYSTWPNVADNINSNYPYPATSTNSGKLTLKKVWFEYQGVKSAKISPYEFSYEYKKKEDFAPEVQNRYPDLFDMVNGNWPGFTVEAEHPEYNPLNFDAWGDLQYKHEDQKRKMRNWTNQGFISQYDATKNYDPAAHLLKNIKLPSGAEIIIHYESKTYTKVQDQDVLAMVSLKSNSQDDDENNENKYYLNLDDLAIDISWPEADEIVDILTAEYKENSNKPLYFKFLYALDGGNPQLDGKNSEYISGYSTVNDVGKDVNGVWVKLGNTVSEPFEKRSDIPRKLCYDHVIYNYNFPEEKAAALSQLSDGIANLYAGNGWTADLNNPNSTTNNTLGATLKSIGNSILGQAHLFTIGLNSKMEKYCKRMNPELSYLRIPMSTPKKGGGIRVKRILMYDEGIDAGDAYLAGTEYKYVKEDGTCSGVAANEPVREENALVRFTKRHPQKWLNKVIAGRDREEHELPLGESILPGPSVGYSRVEVHNIATPNVNTKANVGYAVQKFNTYADYPLSKYVYHTDLNGKGNRAHKRRFFLPIPSPVFSATTDHTWATQGYSFIQHELHGKPKAITSYGMEAGVPVEASRTEYQYVNPGEPVSVIRYIPGHSVPLVGWVDERYAVEDKLLGRQEDITMAMKNISSSSMDIRLEFDIDVLYVPAIGLTAFPQIHLDDRSLSKHVTSKVNYMPAIVKSVTTTSYGVTNTVENLAFSSITGQPILTKSTDGHHNVYTSNSGTTPHDGSVYNWSFPAAWYYSQLQSKHPDRVNGFVNANGSNELNAMAGSLTLYGTNPIEGVASGNSINLNLINGANDNVLAASATTFETDWLTDDMATEYGVDAGDQQLMNNRVKPKTTWVYTGNGNTIVGAKPANEEASQNPLGQSGYANNKTYESGTFDNFTMFDWINPANNTEWTAVSEITEFSPHGQALESKNLLQDVYSAVRFGYKHQLPVATAGDARYVNIGFQSFEDETYTSVANATKVEAKAHTGRFSLELANAASLSALPGIYETTELRSDEKGVQVKLWVYNELDAVTGLPIVDYFDPGSASLIKAQLGINSSNFYPVDFEAVAQSGEWVLLAFTFDKDHVNANTSNTVVPLAPLVFTIQNNTGAVIWIDDVRLQPASAEMACYVYDPQTFRVLAMFNSEHFGTFYIYDDKGKLNRKQIETERGVKTIQESHYNGVERER